jgi:hypothetical protein
MLCVSRNYQRLNTKSEYKVWFCATELLPRHVVNLKSRNIHIVQSYSIRTTYSIIWLPEKSGSSWLTQHHFIWERLLDLSSHRWWSALGPKAWHR